MASIFLNRLWVLRDSRSLKLLAFHSYVYAKEMKEHLFISMDRLPALQQESDHWESFGSTR